jgi:hypothetical protein
LQFRGGSYRTNYSNLVVSTAGSLDPFNSCIRLATKPGESSFAYESESKFSHSIWVRRLAAALLYPGLPGAQRMRRLLFCRDETSELKIPSPARDNQILAYAFCA